MFSLVLTTVPRDVAASMTHDPILIDGNQEFTAENGVVKGSGTSSDPYIIEGWQINPNSGDGIYIAHTTVHFVIRNVIIQGDSISPGLRGLVLDQAQNFVIDAVDVSGCEFGLVAHKAADSVITRCSVHDSFMAMYVSYSRNVVIDGNSMYSNEWSGITFDSSYHCEVMNNELANGGIGIHYSREITVDANSMIQCGVSISGRSPFEFSSHTITPDNTINGLPVQYYCGVRGLHLEGIPAGEIILAGCVDVELVGLTFSGSSTGVVIGFSSSVSFDSCVFQGNGWGVAIWNSAGIEFLNCQFSGNSDGIRTFYSAIIAVSGCDFSGNSYGIDMYRTEIASIEDSTFSGNHMAMYIQECGRIMISGNRITSNADGVLLWFCSRILVSGNEISYSAMSGWGTGLTILEGTKVVVVGNNFIGNEIQASAYEGDITWDDGTSIGNYWDDYAGSDENGDLIGDTPYVVDSDNQDNFPHMIPFN